MDAPQIDPAVVAHLKLALASFCGGMVRLFFRPAASFAGSMWLLFGCVSCGYWGTPAVMRWWELDDSYVGAVGALAGFIGLSVAEGLLKFVDNLDFKAWLVKLLTKNPTP